MLKLLYALGIQQFKCSTIWFYGVELCPYFVHNIYTFQLKRSYRSLSLVLWGTF